MDLNTIRQKAETLLEQEYPEKDLEFDKEDLSQILHELRVYQIELELQNDELRRVQTELQTTQRKYFNLFNLAPVSYFTFNQHGQILELNLTATQLLKRDRKYLADKPLLPYIAPESHQLFFEHLEQVFNTKKEQKCELTIRRKNGSKQEKIVVKVDSIAVKENDVWVCWTTMSDINQQKALEEEIHKNQKLEAVGILAGGIAHDFNNLLTGLFGNIEMAKMSLSPQHEAYLFLERAMQSMENATALTKQLLTFAKGGDPIVEIIPIGQLIAETAQFSLRGSRVKLQTNINPQLWRVEADKGQLRQVISNLVINAQQAMPKGGTIKITADNVETSTGNYVQISVQDQGTGIHSQHLNKIFDPYFSTKQQGNGLGLTSSYSIINKHNGTIKVDSQLNQGTTFTIQLPKVEEKWIKKLVEKVEPLKFFPAKILVLDDEEAIREVLKQMLERLGHQVIFAIDGQEAINTYKEAYKNGTPFDAAIMDLTIPGGMGGQEAAQEILTIDPMAKIIATSGYATDPVMANYKMYGFEGRIVKPYGVAELKNVIQQVLKP